VEHPTGNQPPSVGESSRAAEERAESSDVANQHTPEQQHDKPAPTVEEPNTTLGGVRGVVVFKKSGTGNPTIEGLVAEAAAVEEEAEIEEIVR
jgi:hypothetical protein